MENILEHKLLEIGNYNLTVLNAAAIIIIVLSVWLFLKIFKKIIGSNFRIRESKQYAIYQIIKYVLIIIAFVICLSILGLNVKAMLVGSAALLVGVGLGLQNLFNDFVSGVIILLDSSVKVHDIIEVNGLVSRVQKINIRTTTVLTRDDKYIILPNSTLTSNQLINWTHGHLTSRFEIIVGVDYSSDVHKAMKIMKTVAEDHTHVLKTPKPFVRLVDFGNSSVDLMLMFWSDEVFRVENVKSEIRIKIFDLFSENGITIPFPQRVVHMKNQ
jgi:small-conductance mechanosensitive channel